MLSVPMALVVTSTPSSQLAPEDRLALLIPTVPAPGTAERVPLHVPLVAVKLAFAGVSMMRPVGRVSVKATPVSAVAIEDGLLT